MKDKQYLIESLDSAFYHQEIWEFDIESLEKLAKLMKQVCASNLLEKDVVERYLKALLDRAQCSLTNELDRVALVTIDVLKLLKNS